MPTNEANPDVYQFLAQRQSGSILIEPKPSYQELQKILAIAGTVPDHGALKPFRFIIIQNEARKKFGEALVNAAEEAKGSLLDEKTRPKIFAKAFAAPVLIVIIFSPVDSPRIPLWEQQASASCTGYALDLAANSLGFGAVWKNFAYEPGHLMKQLCQLKPEEFMLGWVGIGTEQERERSPREALDLKRHAVFLD